MNNVKLISKEIIVNGLKIHMRVSENPSAKTPIILVHGLAVSSRYMEPLANELASNCNVITPDFPGHGRSTKPKRVLTIRQQADFLADLINKLHIKKAVLLGNSFGCQIVVDFAVRYPEMVTHIILAGPTMDTKDRNFIEQTTRLFMDMFREPISYIPVILRESFDVGLHRILKNTDYSLDDSIEKKLPKIVVPTLVIRGERDPIVPQRWADSIASLVPTSANVVIPNAGHVINYNSPKKFAKHVSEFLRKY